MININDKVIAMVEKKLRICELRCFAWEMKINATIILPKFLYFSRSDIVWY